MINSNIAMLQIVARLFGDLINEIVFVGGAVAELYADNPDIYDVRPTLDVDCIIEISSRLEYEKLEKKLRKKGFINDTSKDTLICRWIINDIKVDVMPTDEKILGFSNKWYVLGIKNKISKKLLNGIEIHILLPEYYLATKLAAHNNRGGNDLRQSHDFEDIICMLDNCSNIPDRITCADTVVKKFVKEEFEKLLDNDSINEGIECAMPYGSEDERYKMIKDVMNAIVMI